MKIYGFQKLTLLDFPGRTACTLFTGGCNMRCPFCHNSPLVELSGEDITYPEEDILSFLDKRQGLLDGVAITGGEPLINKDIIPFMEKIKNKGFPIKLDTNGTFPERLREILSLGLADYVAVDIKNSREKYPLTAGTKLDLSLIDTTVELLMTGKTEYEFRTTVVKEFHEKEDIIKISEWIKGAEKYYLQSFKDSGNILTEGCSAHTKEALEEMAEAAGRNVKLCEIRGV